jgi:hypothetical protein
MIASLVNVIPSLQLQRGNAKRRRAAGNSTSSDEASESDVEMVDTQTEDQDVTTTPPPLQDDIEIDRADSPIDVDSYEEVDDASVEKDEVVVPQLDDIREWQLRIRVQSKDDFFTIRAPTAPQASPAIIHLVKSLLSGIPTYDYKPEDPLITCEIWMTRSLVSPLRPFYM